MRFLYCGAFEFKHMQYRVNKYSPIIIDKIMISGKYGVESCAKNRPQEEDEILNLKSKFQSVTQFLFIKI